MHIFWLGVALLAAQGEAVARDTVGAREASPREISVCKARFPFGLFMDEESVFKGWRRAAGRGGAHAQCGPGRDDVRLRSVRFTAGDGASLAGCLFSARGAASSGYALIAQGNAWTARDVVETFMPLAVEHPEIDFYVYDFRGYPGSEGNPFFHAMIEDYKDILSHLNTEYEDADKHLYGFSFGGLLLINALDGPSARTNYRSMVIDSTPGTVNFGLYDCADEYSPKRRLDESGPCRNVTFMRSPGDYVVPLSRTQPLWDAVGRCGGRRFEYLAKHCPGAKGEFNHPFQGEDALLAKCRLARIGLELFGP